jgi:hypothetical protein
MATPLLAVFAPGIEKAGGPEGAGRREEDSREAGSVAG